MGFWSGNFSPKDNTISDKEMAKLRKKAEHAQKIRGGMFSKKAVKQRHASQEQRSMWRWS